MADAMNPDAFFDRLARLEDELARLPVSLAQPSARRSAPLGRVWALGAAVVGIVVAGALASSMVV